MTSYRLEQYCNQTAEYKAKAEVDRYGNQTYQNPVQIRCRIEYGAKMVRNTTGEEVVSETTIFTVQPVQPLDMINDKEVINIASMVNRLGQVIGYEVYL